MSTMPSTASSRRCEVWGAPIRHSRSPELHRAAYQVLGLDWEYRRHEVTAEQFPQHFDTLAPEVQGLSLTMPLKEVVLDQVTDHRGPVDLLHAANTAVKGSDGWWLDNTDWWGAWRTIQDAGGSRDHSVWLLGAGATARAVLYALAQDVPHDLALVVRSPERAQVTKVLADTLGLSPTVFTFDQLPANLRCGRAGPLREAFRHCLRPVAQCTGTGVVSVAAARCFGHVDARVSSPRPTQSLPSRR